MIRRAVIPVAGLGTRLLPSTKSQPKEMLPVGRKPVVQYVVEELHAASVHSVVMITGRGKRTIEDHFDHDDELQKSLKQAEKDALLNEIDFQQMNMVFYYTRQTQQLGLGHAVGFAEEFCGDEPFVVALGDSIVRSIEEPAVKRLIRCFEDAHASCAILFEEVPRSQVYRYGIAKPSSDADFFEVEALIEKPTVECAPSCLAIAARYVLSPSIFDAIRRTKPGSGGEIQLTDAIRLLMEEGEKVVGLKMSPGERRYDIGNFGSYFRSFVDFALDDPVHGPALKRYIESIMAPDREKPDTVV